MMTRAGRSARTVSTVLPNVVVPVRGGSGSTIARARICFASSTMTRPAWPARTFVQRPLTRRPKCTRACSMMPCAVISWSGSWASMGDEFGTVMVTRM